MKLYIFLALSIVVLVESGHTFLGTNVLRPQLYHRKAEYSSKFLQKRIENIYYQIPSLPGNRNQAIHGILAYDKTNSDASANVTMGGLGFNYVNLRLKSSRGMKLDYDIYIYA